MIVVAAEDAATKYHPSSAMALMPPMLSTILYPIPTTHNQCKTIVEHTRSTGRGFRSCLVVHPPRATLDTPKGSAPYSLAQLPPPLAPPEQKCLPCFFYGELLNPINPHQTHTTSTPPIPPAHNISMNSNPTYPHPQLHTTAAPHKSLSGPQLPRPRQTW